MIPLLRIIVLSYLGYALLMFFMQRSLIYPGTALSPPAKPANLPAGSEILQLDLPPGKLTARFIPAAPDGRRHPAMIVCHGNMELAEYLPMQFLKFQRMGISLLLLEYPGYAGMPGKPSQSSITAAAVTAYDVLLKRPDVDPERIIALGRSLGGGVACALSRQRQLQAIMLLSSFTSLRPMAHRYLLPGFLVRDPYDNLQALKSFAGPVLIMHGRQDMVVPFPDAQQLAAAAVRPTLVLLDAGHDDLMESTGFWPVVNSFLRDAKIIPNTQKGV